MNRTNIDDVTRFLENFVDSFDFRRPGFDQSLGRDIAMKVVDRIQTRALAERRGAGEKWDDNEPKYRKWKEKNYGVGEPNSRTGQMLSQKSLYGRTVIESRDITMIYGVGEPPDRAAWGSPRKELLAQDQKVTDVQKAYYAHTGQSVHKITRPFYEVDESDGKAVSELCQQNLNDLIREKNAENGYT